jgi:cholesterol oxidase
MNRTTRDKPHRGEGAPSPSAGDEVPPSAGVGPDASASTSRPCGAIRWLSQPLETFLVERSRRRQIAGQDASDLDFDVLIVGSGYGGAVAAQQLMQCIRPDGKRLRVAVLERGREYLPGQFPSRLADLPAHVRVAGGPGRRPANGEGLFDVRLGPDAVVLAGSGLGGGSLINAGVMEPALPQVFTAQPWPASFRQQKARMPHWYRRASAFLAGPQAPLASGAALPLPKDSRAGGHPMRRLDSMEQWGAAEPPRPVHIAVNPANPAHQAAGLPSGHCIGCGDCATGCNFGAKRSLDTHVLWEARKHGVTLITGATVTHLQPWVGDVARRGTEPAPGQQAPGRTGWQVSVVFSDEGLARREPHPFEITARRVILAAGTLGSTEILMRSRAHGLEVSGRLGFGFSGNGDVLAAAVDLPAAVGAVADEAVAPALRSVGPTITGMLDLRSSQGFVVQDLAVPAALREVWQESFALADTFDGLTRPDDSIHPGEGDASDPLAVTDERTDRILPLAIMGLDDAAGQLAWSSAGAAPEAHSERDRQSAPRAALTAKDIDQLPVGTLAVHWPELKNDPRIAQRHDWLTQRLKARKGRLLANPLWRFLPEGVESMVGAVRGPVITVHPLGGCGMGDSPAHGVVNEWGQVFQIAAKGQPAHASPVPVYEGLVVLDGSVVPTALGINPALTITALALRAMAHLKKQWQLQPAAAAEPERAPNHWASRPIYRAIPLHTAPKTKDTMVEFRERLGGFVRWPDSAGSGGDAVKYLEFTFVYDDKRLRELLRPGPGRALVSSPSRSVLRVFATRPDPSASDGFRLVGHPSARVLWRHLEMPDSEALAVIPLSHACLTLFERDRSTPAQRMIRAGKAWWVNRGWRDISHALMDRWGGQRAQQPPSANLGGARGDAGVLADIRNLLMVAQHAGQERLMRYEITLGDVAPSAPQWIRAICGLQLKGVKCLTYSHRGNPWKQLCEMKLNPSPWTALQGGPPVMALDLFYLARQRQPLLRLTSVEDAPSAIRDVAQLLGYMMRLLVDVHLWTFRKPDAPLPRQIQRLPGAVPGLPMPEVVQLVVGRWGDAGLARRALEPVVQPEQADLPVMIRLTRYRREASRHEPVLMIHGYSASGTTFAHPAVPDGAAKVCWDAGFDVWIVDMRTSSGLPTARLPWTFEDAALNDIPVAIDHVLRATGHEKLHLLAHCMGSSKVHMALLEDRQQPCERFFDRRKNLKARIRSLVVSQVTARMVFSPANTLRAMLMQYVRPLLPLQNYSFRPEGEPTLQDQLIDRLLASLPYSDQEFDLENPSFPSLRRTPWVRTRHRMDLLYGADFAPANVSEEFLAAIDDHFGPLNLDTVAQAIEFARAHRITDWQGANVYLNDVSKTLAMLRAFPILSIHGQHNGLCDADSALWMAEHFNAIEPGRFRFHIVPGHGHQDCLVGRDAKNQVFRPVVDFFKASEP